jgi:hypothetical protein
LVAGGVRGRTVRDLASGLVAARGDRLPGRLIEEENGGSVGTQQLDHSGQLTQKVTDIEAAEAGVRHRGDGAFALLRPPRSL